MSRTAYPDSGRKGLLLGAIFVAVICSFLPQSVLSWFSAPRRLIEMSVAPVSGPAHDIAGWLAPAAPKPDDPRIAHLESERDRFKVLFAQSQLTVEQLQRRIDELQKYQSVSEAPVRQLPARVVGGTSSASGGIIQVRAGSGSGLETNMIATVAGTQLVGKVTDAGSMLSKVTLITDKNAGKIDGVILDDAGSRRFTIRNMAPIRGQSILQGWVQYQPGGPNDQPKVDDVVRLEDREWPTSAQRLTVGIVTKVTPSAGAGRTIVEVKPTAELERITEVVLLITSDTPGDKR